MGDITMQDYAKLRKLDDDELNQVSGGGVSGGDGEIPANYRCENCGNNSFERSSFMLKCTVCGFIQSEWPYK